MLFLYSLLIFNEATVMFSVQYNKTHEHFTCFKKLHGTLSRAEHTHNGTDIILSVTTAYYIKDKQLFN